MPRRLAPTIIVFFFVFISFFLVPTAHAAADPTPTPVKSDDLDAVMEQKGSMDKSLQEFCAKRQGNLMNLETWYSGKCPGKDDEFDSYSGEGVGFSDIVILDLAERVSGSKDPKKTFSQRLKELFKTLKDLSYVSPNEYQIALNDARQKLIFDNNTGLVAESGKMISLLYRYQPASTGSYLAYVTQNLQDHKIIPPALAASTGVGFSTFSPFIELWKIVRNLAYFALILFFIVYGFMIMFRINLGQKTVITVQLAIPKLVITLLVITFSYAIVGLIYDLMWVLVYFFIGYLDSQKIIFFTNIAGINWSPANMAYGNSIFGFQGSLVINSIIAGPAAIFGILNILFGGTIAAIGVVLSGLVGIIYLIIMIAVLISYGKLFVKLIGAFIYVVISLITGPIILLGNVLPGSQAIGSWIRNIVANLFIFPVTMLFLLFSYFFMVQPLVGMCVDTGNDFYNFLKLDNDISENFCQGLFGVKNLVPSDVTDIKDVPLISPPDFLGGFDARGLLALVGVGLLLMAPKYVEMVRDALKVSPFKYGSALGDALKSTGSAVGGAVKTGAEGVKKVASMRGSGEEKPQSTTDQTASAPSRPISNAIPISTAQTSTPPSQAPDRPTANISPTAQTSAPSRPAEPTPAKPTPLPAPKA